MSGHSDSMAALAPVGIDLFARPAPADADRSGARAIPRPTLEAIYEAHFDFVWRSVRRLTESGRWPSNFASCGFGSNMSICDGPPAMNRKMTFLAFAASRGPS